MGQWSQIAAGADGTFLWNHWTDTAIQQFTKCFDNFQSNSAESEGQHVRTQ